MARPPKPMFPAAPGTLPLPVAGPLADAMEVLAEGALSREAAAEFASLSVPELDRVIERGELETFSHGRRVLIPKRSVQMWLAKKLASERAERKRLGTQQGVA